MALIDADFDNIGDTFEVALDPISQVISFDSFTDSITGETGTKFLVKEFRYGTDGVSWGAWTSLTNPNLVAITTNPLTLYYFEVRYTRGGTDATGTITWNSWILSATIDPTIDTSFCGNIFSVNNLFCDLKTNDPVFNQLCGNLLDKVVKYGIVPKYVSDEDGIRTDDYKDFWKSVCCWFSLHFVFAKQFADIYTTVNLLTSFLRQRGVYLCGNEDIIEIQQIANTYYNGIRQRGTQEADTEIKRLLCTGDCDEFIFALMRRFEAGAFTVDRSSPLYKGNIGIQQMNKMVEKTESVSSLQNFHLVGTTNILTNTKNDGTPVDSINIVTALSTTGIKQNGGKSGFKMVVDPNLNYEISFFVKMPVVTGNILSFGVDGWDCEGNKLANPTEDIVTGNNDQYFFRQGNVIKQTTDYVQVRGIIWNQSEALKTPPDELLSFGYGSNLRFKSNVSYIYPIIVIEDGITLPLNDTFIYGVKVNIVSNPYSLGFVNFANFLITYFKNNSNDLTIDDIKKIVDRDMIPANTTIGNIIEI